MFNKTVSIFLIFRIVIGSLLGVIGCIYLTSNFLEFDIPSMVFIWLLGGLFGSLIFAPKQVGRVYSGFYYYVIGSVIYGD